MNFRLPQYFYKVGMLICGASIIMMFVRAFALDGDQEMLREILRKTLLIGMLLMSVARDKDEDELVVKLKVRILI